MDFQSLKTNFYSILFQFGSNSYLISFCFLVGLFYSLNSVQTFSDRLKIIFLCLSILVSSLFGARIFHVLFEKPELLKNPELIFTHYDGMTFNGSLLFGFLIFYFSLRFFTKEQRPLLWDKLAIITAFSYGVLRIGCFANGCCWGKISAVSWHVKYTHSQYMPWLGLPVHPVQLYDSLLGFFILTILLNCKHKKKLTGHLFPIFLILYSCGRFITEYFRGDSFRGENLIFNLSTSQIVSVLTILGVSTFYLIQSRKAKKHGIISLIALAISGCLPTKPNENEFWSIQKNNFYEIYHTRKSLASPRRNVLFLAGDDNIQFAFKNSLSSLYQTDTPPRIEDLVFWDYLKPMKNLYNVIVRIPYQKMNYQSFSDGLQYMESLKQPYDLIILTHGLPNHLSTGTGYFFSYKELNELNKKLPHLNLVLMQSCYGQSLAKDFKNAGAKYVISYQGLNSNFFFFKIFLNYYEIESIEQAYSHAKNSFSFHMKMPMNAQIANMIVAQKPPLTVDQFVASLPLPVLQ